MKSLEHLIREIQEGKIEKTEKKSLEGSIRNIMSKESSYAAKDSKPVDEHCGCEDEKKKKKVSKEDGDKLPGAEDKMDEAIGALGTDKYQGTEFKSIRTATPHIQPPKGDETHSQAPENASRLRSIAKEKQGINRVTEELVDEQAVPKFLPIPKFTPKAGAAPKIKPVEPEPVLPEPPPIEPVKPGKDVPRPDQKPANDPAPAPKPSEPKPANDPGKPATKPAEKPTTKPQPVEQPSPAPATKPQVAPAPAIKPQVAPAPELAPAPATKPQLAPAPAPATAAALAPAQAPAQGPQRKQDQTPKDKWKFPKISLPSADSPDIPGKPHIQAPWRVEKHYRHRHFKESTEQRKQIEDMPRKDAGERPAYVGRPSDDPKTAAEKTSRQAQYKIKVIDESKKLASIIKKTTKEYESGGKPKVFDRGEDVIVINPDLNKNSLDTKQ